MPRPTEPVRLLLCTAEQAPMVTILGEGIVRRCACRVARQLASPFVAKHSSGVADEDDPLVANAVALDGARHEGDHPLGATFRGRAKNAPHLRPASPLHTDGGQAAGR
jgi:hypothetical protein